MGLSEQWERLGLISLSGYLDSPLQDLLLEEAEQLSSEAVTANIAEPEIRRDGSFASGYLMLVQSTVKGSVA